MGIPTQAVPDLTALNSLARTNLFVVHDGTEMKKITLQQLEKYFIADGAGAHNSIYRGKYLGSSYTSAQKAAIAAGTFDDLFIGDYWTIGSMNYRIAAFDYYYQCGGTACTKHHAVIVPDDQLYTHVMNDSSTTEGGYVGSKMYTTGLANAKTTIQNAFGSSYILTHKAYLSNAVTNGRISGASTYDSQVELMTERNVYGASILCAANDGGSTPVQLYTYDKTQYPLFAFRPDLIIAGVGNAGTRHYYWLQDVVSAAYFAYVSYYGFALSNLANNVFGVRPRFSIVGS